MTMTEAGCDDRGEINKKESWLNKRTVGIEWIRLSKAANNVIVLQKSVDCVGRVKGVGRQVGSNK